MAAMVMGSGLRSAQAGTTLTGTFPAGITLPATDFVFIDGATVTGNVTNSSTLGIAPIALEISGGLISGGVTNTSGATISASQVGIYIHDGADIGDGITNDGEIIVSNAGNGLQVTPVAGVWVSSAGDTSLVNNGNIQVTASRSGSGILPPIAWAGGVGFINGTGDVDITNSGDISVLAKASGAPVAFAGAAGIFEIASSTGTSLDISLWNTYDASLSVKAQATASGIVGPGVAGAGVLGIFQAASGAGDVAIDLTNDGSIEISAAANATGATAAAGALVGYGVAQFASAGGAAGDTASASLTNTSNLSLDILANATATGASASATALMGFAIDQHAGNAEDVSVSLDNSGAIRIAAEANAIGGAAALAVASVGVSVTGVSVAGPTFSWTSATVVHQSASAIGNSGSTATVTLNNSSTFDISAIAYASASGTATASAHVYNAISQHAHNAEDSSVLLANSGELTVTANAQATASSNAWAHAHIDDAIYQHASGNGSDDSIARATLTNSAGSTIDIVARATGGVTSILSTPSAAGTSSSWIAATIEDAIYQNADNADQAILSITNEGTINILASADANGISQAYAYASVDDGVDQHATAANNDVLVEVTYTNDGPLDIGAVADAFASTGSAEASALVTDGVHQYADSGAATTVEITNSSDISIAAQARADAADTATAYAYVTMAVGLTASGSSSDGSEASATLTNSTDATMNILAYATASGTDAFASANINSSSGNAAIYQEATGADAASVTLTNQGTINIIAKAVANGSTYSADAYANNDTAIWQTVDADNNEISAIASLTNSGPLYIAAQATASQATSSSAQATADIHYAIWQQATDGKLTEVALTNNSSLSILAQAKAFSLGTNTGNHTATASASLDDAIVQFATGNSVDDSTAVAQLTNSVDATLDILAYATASGTDASANAALNGTGTYAAIYQEATGADDASAVFTNVGTINIVAKAIANGSTYSADAYADNNSAIWQTVDADNNETSASATLTNSGPLYIAAVATASQATSSSAYASAFVQDAIWQEAGDAALTTVSLTNDGSLRILAQARALSLGTNTGNHTATASAYVSDGIIQIASGNSTDDSEASAILTNSVDATLNILAYATASGTDASANAYINSSSGNAAIYQEADGADTVSVALNNSGTINIIAKAIANGSTYSADAYADNDTAIWQVVDADNNELSAIASLTNDGPLNIHALAYAATRSYSATATADLDYAIYQEASDGALTTVELTNNSTLTIKAIADASVSGSSGTAYADATIDQAIYQSALGRTTTASDVTTTATAAITNTSSLTISADADAVAGEIATAYATITSGIVQEAYGAEEVLVSFSNSGTVSVTADAYAEAFDAYAQAIATAVKQYATATTAGMAELEFDNSATFEVSALAVAKGQHNGQTTTSATATATAEARGVRQKIEAGGSTITIAAFNNSGSFTVMATASASATVGTASNSANADAYARGYRVYSDTEGYTANLDVTNSGDMYISAKATIVGTGSAAAQARGILLQAETLTGTFLNSGNLTVMASAPDGSAEVRGLDIRADDASGAFFSNTGTIAVAAVGTTAEAIAVRFRSYTATGTGTGANTASFTNDGGTISAWVTSSGTLDYGYAFMTEHPTYAVRLNWQGNSADGSISGHVEIKTGDMINVTNGTTWFDGAINPTIDDNAGMLDIFDDGKLVLALNQDLGPNTSYVDTFTVQSDGTIGFEIEAESGDISRIDAITANLDGTIMVTALAGLYSGTQTYQDVIDADTRIGTFVNETTATPLLDLAVVYDGSDNVDLTLTRVAFDAVDGLTINQKSVASGIETTYSTLLSDQASYTDYADLVGELFTLDDTEYPDALDQISGVEYAGTLQAALGSFRYFLNAVQDRADNPPDEGTSTSAFLNPLFAGATGDDGRRAVWASVQGGHGDQDGDGNASGYSYNQVTALFGVDGMVNERLLIGVAGGLYAPGDIDFDNGNTVNQDNGYQIGAYAKYDTGRFYARGFAGYGAWDASATRTISIGTLSGTNTASFDVDAWNVTGEAGYKFNHARFDLTPFAGLSYTRASVGNYVESGFAASALSGSGDDDQFDGYLGLRISGVSIKREKLTILPELAVGYVHNFSDEASVTNALINAPTGTNFTIIGPEHGGAGFVDFSTTVVMGNRTSLSLGYLGEFGSDHQDHSGYGKFKVNF